MQIRDILIVCALLLANVMAPALAADKAVGQPVGAVALPKGTQSNPTLNQPGQGTKLPGSTKAIGGPGAPGSLNFSDKATPLGAPTVGGKQVGGAKAIPAVGKPGTPTSGNTLVNPLKDSGGGATTSLDQFTKESRLNKLTGAGQNVLDQAGGNTAPGRPSGDSLLGATNPDFAAGKGKGVSKQGQQSTSAPPDFTTTPTPSGAVPIPYPNATGDTADKPKAEVRSTLTTSSVAGIVTGDETGAGKSTTELRGQGPGIHHVRDSSLLVGTSKEPTISGKQVVPAQAKVVVEAGRPAPDGPGAGENDIGSSLPGANKPTVDQAIAAKKRQAGMPIEGKQEIERMKGNQRAAADTMARKRANAINPGSENSTVGAVHSSGGAKPTGNSPEGGPQGGSTGRPGGCPADSPSC